MRTTWTFHSAGQIVFGRNAAEQLGGIVAGLRAKRAMLVTDPALKRAGMSGRIQTLVEAGGTQVTVFDGGEPEPSMQAALSSSNSSEAFSSRIRSWPLRPRANSVLTTASNSYSSMPRFT